MRQVGDMVSGFHRKYSESSASTWHLVMALLGFAMLALLFWHFEMIEDLLSRVVLTTMSVLWPLQFIKKEKEYDSPYSTVRWRLSSGMYEGVLWICIHLGIVLWMASSVVALFSDRYEWSALGTHAAVLWFTIPPLFAFGFIVRGQRIVGVALLPAMFVMMASWTWSLLRARSELDPLLLPLLVISIGGVAWGLLALAFLNYAERWRHLAIRGPLMELVSMTFLFVPFMYFTIEAVRILPNTDTWLPVTVTVIGVLLGTIVSKPLRKLLIACWDPPPPCGCESAGER